MESIKKILLKMTQSQQVIEELYDSYTKIAANIIAYYGTYIYIRLMNQINNIFNIFLIVLISAYYKH